MRHRSPGRARLALAGGLVCALVPLLASSQEPQRRIPLSELRSGSAFVTSETRAQQDDLTVNPGMLWVEQGERLWRQPAGSENKSCASCHGQSSGMQGAAARYPLYDRKLGRVVNIEQRIQSCRAEHQKGAPLAYESQDLLGLTALVAHQSRGQPFSVRVEGPARATFELGRALYNERQGQLNLSCAQCHEDSWGKRLRTERISQGHATGFPIYRLEWQTMGSLHRRLRACFQGVRAESFAYGSPEFVALELYLAWRAASLPIETPGVRR